MKRLIAAVAIFPVIITLPFNSLARNIPGLMLSGGIAYQILRQEGPTTIPTVRSFLEKNPWYETRWKPQLEKLSEGDQDEVLFMLAARWADDVRTQDPSENRLSWHYIDFPFKPEGEPADIQAIQPPQENILTAIAENERIVRSGNEPARRGIALTWLVHLLGHVNQALHAVQLFSREYPNGDRGGGEFCVRVAQDRVALSRRRLWDGLLTSSNNARTLRNMAIEVRNRFPRTGLTELAGVRSKDVLRNEFILSRILALPCRNGRRLGRA